MAEGAVRTDLRGGGRIDAPFCDVFHFRDDKICRLVPTRSTVLARGTDAHRDNSAPPP